ncbi:MAG: DNA translocase FtsK, partial [Planctomycetes bacterium]|nr:DNA translocase FtsK [Planctomycetota bacterium]
KSPGLPRVNHPLLHRPARAEPYPRQIQNWRLPAIDLLAEPQYGFTAQQETVVREQARTLERTLEEFRLDARVVEIDTGPVITMFELKLGAGIKVSQIATLSNDIARALKAHAIRVVAPISGKNTVGIEVPNIQKEAVRLRELMTSAGKRAAGMGLPLFLGKDAGGAALVADLTKMPHLLIAGTTGSGKSVCLNAVTLSLLMTQRPDHVKMILVDPKMVEMAQFKGVPHLMCPIVTDMIRAEKILGWAVTKMEERYELIAEAGVKSVAAYNKLGAEELYKRLEPGSPGEKAQIVTHVPYVVIIIDELADLMMTAAKEVEHHLSRLAQKSRAVGIHIIVATQRPEAKVVTGLIKSNLPSRICFRVASRMDSRIVLDQNGGEVLLGQGDMLFLPPGSHKLVRAQGTFLEDQEIAAVLDDLGARAKPEFHPELMRIKKPGDDDDPSLRDPLFDSAVGIILQSKRGSVSLLQRRLTIGYSRASRLIDQMADAGIVGEYKGSQAREVLITPKEWEALRDQIEAELEEGYEADDDSAYDEAEEDDEVPALSDNHDIRG